MTAAGTAVPLHRTSYDRPVAELPTQPGRDVPMLGSAVPLPEHCRLVKRSPLTVTWPASLDTALTQEMAERSIELCQSASVAFVVPFVEKLARRWRGAIA